MKKRMVLFIVLCFCFMTSVRSVSAKEVVYTNEKGFEFSQDEYVFFKKVYGEKLVQKYFDEDLYNEFTGIDFANTPVKTKTYSTNESRQNPSKDSPYFSSPAKSIQISKVCTSIMCRIFITATWLGDPSVKSYDDIGAYLDGPTRLGTPATLAYSDQNSNFAAATKYDTNGYGASVLLPQGDNIIVTQNFAYTGTGTVYGSYQHAMNSTTLTIAQKFNISPVGFGEVFGFYDEALNVYDDMNGVNLDV